MRLLLLTLVVSGPAARALTLLDVSGPITTGGQLATAHQAIAVAFTLNQTFINVKVSTGTPAQPFITVNGVGEIAVTRNLGPTATGGDIVAVKPLANAVTQFIDGMTLTAGTYYFLVSVDSGTVG